jgi:hypothetical protein
MASIVIAAIGVAISAISMWIARRSSRTAREVLTETRRNNQLTQLTRSRSDSIQVFDDAMNLIEALARDATRAPQRVDPARDALLKSAEAAGMMTSPIRELLSAQEPISHARVDDIRMQLLARVGHLAWQIDQRQRMNELTRQEDA